MNLKLSLRTAQLRPLTCFAKVISGMSDDLVCYDVPDTDGIRLVKERPPA